MKSKEKKPMSLGRKILSVVLKVLLAILIIIVIAVTVFAVMFWDTFVNIVKNPAMIPYVIENFDTFSRGLNASSEEIEAERKANNEAQAQAFADANINLKAEDIEALSDATLTEKERADMIYQAMTGGKTEEAPKEEQENVGEDEKADGESAVDPENAQENKETDSPETKPDDATTDDKKNETENDKPTADTGKPSTQPGKPSAETEKPVADNKPTSENKPTLAPATPNTASSNSLVMTEEQYNTRVSELVAKMYSIKADFMAKLSAFEAEVISEYKALPAEQRTSATKTRIVSENMNYIMGLEAQCDAQVKAVTDELTALMTANGKPTTLVDQINTAYINEKENKKAYYVSLYK